MSVHRTLASHPKGAGLRGAKAVFLDRDGVINVDRGYVCRWEDFEFIPGVVDAMLRLSESGFILIIVTNQSGIARGFYTKADYFELTEKYLTELKKFGVNIAASYFCPHHSQGIIPEYSINCSCRKPKPGMLLRAQREFSLDMARSIMIGDRFRDVEAAVRAGVGSCYLVGSKVTDAVPTRSRVEGIYPSLEVCAREITETI